MPVKLPTNRGCYLVCNSCHAAQRHAALPGAARTADSAHIHMMSGDVGYITATDTMRHTVVLH
jgi:hypothetical protein